MSDSAQFQDDPAEPLRAASLILIHDRPSLLPELLIVQRGASLAFAAGAYVFPGGRIDTGDMVEGAALFPHLDPGEAAARAAAIRETSEETGVALKNRGMRALIPFARWLPARTATKRRFDTRFYIARTEERALPVADGHETDVAFWATAEEMLARCDAGDGHAIFPTRRLLERLSCFASFAEARDQAERLPQRIISPWIEHRADGDWLCIPEDAGYPIAAEPIAAVKRG